MRSNYFQKILNNSLWTIILLILIGCNNSEKFFSSRSSIKILHEIEDKIYINIYMSNNLDPKFKQVQNSFIEIINNSKNLCEKEIDYEIVKINDNDSINGKYIYNPLSHLNMHPIWINMDHQKYNKIYPYATINYKGKQSNIKLLNSKIYDTIYELDEKILEESINDLEYNFFKSLYLLKQNKKKKIAFIHGHNELDSNNTWDIRNSLSEFYIIEDFDLTLFEINPIDNNIDIKKQIQKLQEYKTIIIAKPDTNFDKIENIILDQYVMNGGRILWLVDGTTAHMNNFNEDNYFILEKNSTNTENILNKYGVNINNDLILDDRCSKSPFYVQNKIMFHDWKFNPILSNETDHLIINSCDSILTNFCSSIEVIDKKKSTILLTSSLNSQSIIDGNKVSLEIIKSDRIDLNNKLTTGVLLEGVFESAFPNIEYKDENFIFKKIIKKNKMIIISDGDIIANIHEAPNKLYPLGFYHYKNNIFKGNKNFIINCLLYLCDDIDILNLKNRI